MLKRSTAFVALALPLFFTAADPTFAGKGAFRPTYTPTPCSGDDCRADDPKSGTACQGFLCGFVSSKAMQPPVTAAQAAEMERARAAAQAQADAQAAAPTESKPATPPVKTKRVVKTKAAKPATTAKAAPAAPTAPSAAAPSAPN